MKQTERQGARRVDQADVRSHHQHDYRERSIEHIMGILEAECNKYKGQEMAARIGGEVEEVHFVVRDTSKSIVRPPKF